MPSSRRWHERAPGYAVALLVLAASVAYIAWTFQWREALSILGRADLAVFLGGSGLAIVAYWAVRALRWQRLLRAMGVRVPFGDLYLCSSVALSLSVLQPL